VTQQFDLFPVAKPPERSNTPARQPIKGRYRFFPRKRRAETEPADPRPFDDPIPDFGVAR
jgi:hypothetical protein